MTPPIHRYPRTTHLDGSGLQPDDSPDTVAMSALAGRHVVIEEKMDGANCGLRFDAESLELRLQSRGHYLTGGGRERQFDLFKRWAAAASGRLFDVLGTRHQMYGEWVFAKHTVFYDALPHYFLEFDILDLDTGGFLDTPRRAALLRGVPVVPVRVLYAGMWPGEAAVRPLVGPSAFITRDAGETLDADTAALGWNVELTRRQTDLSGRMEGLYVKVEDGGEVVGRYKFVRRDFLQTVLGEGHWQDRPIIPNRLAVGVDLFAGW